MSRSKEKFNALHKERWGDKQTRSVSSKMIDDFLKYVIVRVKSIQLS